MELADIQQASTLFGAASKEKYSRLVSKQRQEEEKKVIKQYLLTGDTVSAIDNFALLCNNHHRGAVYKNNAMQTYKTSQYRQKLKQKLLDKKK